VAMTRKSGTGGKSDLTGGEFLRLVEGTYETFEIDTSGNFDVGSLADGGHYFRTVGSERLGGPSKRGRGGRGAGGEGALQLRGTTGDGESSANGTGEEAHIHTETDHAETLFAAFELVFVTGGDDAGVFSRAADDVVELTDLIGDAGTFPLAAIAGGGRVIGGSEVEEFYAIDLTHLGDLSGSADGLNDGDDKDVFVGFGGVFGEALPPASCAFASDAARTFQRVACVGDGLFELLCGFDPGDDDAVGTDIEGTLDEPGVQLGDAYECDGVAPNCGTEVLDDFFPVEVAVFGVNDDPVEAESHGDFCDTGGFESDPHAVDGLVGGEFLAEFANRGSFHKELDI